MRVKVRTKAKTKVRTKLKRVRESYGYTQQSFADSVGISRSHYAQIETGDKLPSYPVAIRIKNMLHYQGDDLFNNKNFLASSDLK